MEKYPTTVHLLQKYISLCILKEAAKRQRKVILKRVFDLAHLKIFSYTILPNTFSCGGNKALSLPLTWIWMGFLLRSML